MAQAEIIYKICPAALWRRDAGRPFAGSPDDLRDGFIHFSTADQLEGTAARHFAGQKDLLLIAIDAAALGAALKWEPSRGGALFPHLHAPLDRAAVLWEKPLPLGPAGAHVFPEPGR